jgi:hypothetical protein
MQGGDPARFPIRTYAMIPDAGVQDGNGVGEEPTIGRGHLKATCEFLT